MKVVIETLAIWLTVLVIPPVAVATLLPASPGSTIVVGGLWLVALIVGR